MRCDLVHAQRAEGGAELGPEIDLQRVQGALFVNPAFVSDKRGCQGVEGHAGAVGASGACTCRNRRALHLSGGIGTEGV